MKEILKKIFNWKVIEPILVGLGGLAILGDFAFPMLRKADTYTNVLGFLLGLFVVIFLFRYYQSKNV